ncbi:hypothetical protein [Micromonospora sp. CPCC 205556]|uniref:hypothetical protein n=1 Tax=Micromonospora sp. CPCC 205556 TaxID=3122398 RepID=UPI002FF39A60
MSPNALLGPPPVTTTEVGLSCYTAAVARYLSQAYVDPAGRIARSIRLAVRVLPGDLLAFSHHRHDLADLGNGTRLIWRHAPVTAVGDRLAAELARAGQVIVVGHTGALPWSPASIEDSAPHFLLVNRHDRDRWWVVDDFAALLPSGRQEPFAGWVDTRTLLAAMTPPRTLGPEHHLRTAYALGVPTAPPPGRPLWLAARPAAPEPAAGHSGWHTEPLAVLDLLADFFAGLDAAGRRARFVEDLWAAAQHHTYRCSYLLDRVDLSPGQRRTVAAARGAWEALPMALRFAADSAARGRPRPALVAASFAPLRRAEHDLITVLTAHGWHRSGDVLAGSEPREKRAA